jgi:predicted esterase
VSLFAELKRRNVFRVAIAYILLGWAVLQGADFLLDLAGAPEWVMRVFAIAGLVGFVPDNCADDADVSALRGLPIFMAVGSEDERIPYERSLACAAVLRAAGADLAYRDYPTGHKLNGQGLQDLQAWWLERGRSQYHQTRI